jgi:hypothetical protein
MTARWVVPTVVIGAGLLALPTVLPARQQAGNPPGQPTPARVHITNRGDVESLPVVIQSGGEIQPVAVVSAPVISLSPDAHVSTAVRSQAWQYRVIVAKAGEDLTALLDKAGADGWEAVGVIPTVAVAETRVLMKKPR